MMKITAIRSKPRNIRNVGAFFPNAIKLTTGEIFVQMLWGCDRRATAEEMAEFLAVDYPTDWHFWADYNQKWLGKGLDRAQNMNGYWSRSTDGGETFTDWGMPPILSYAEAKGELIGFAWQTHRDRTGNLFLRSWRSADRCATFSAPKDIPIEAPAFEADVLPDFHRGCVHLGGNRWLLAAYARFAGENHDRVIVFRTDDAFKTLRYEATVADWEEGLAGEAGFNEAAICRVPDGRLLAVFRNDGFCDMYQSHSCDEGKTWTKPCRFGAPGVDPCLTVLDNGAVLCAYGRPGIHVAVSFDGGDHWAGRETLLWPPFEIDGVSGETVLRNSFGHQRTCGYTDLVPLGEDRAMVFYSAPLNWRESTHKVPWIGECQKEFRIYAVEITVKKE